MVEIVESESENPWGGEGRPECVYYRNGAYEVQVQGKYVGNFPELWQAIEARDSFRAANPRKKASAPVEKPTPKAHTNGAAPPHLQVGDVVALNSGGEPMTVVGFYPDGVNLMTWSKGKLHKVCLPAQCIRKEADA